MSKKIKLSSLIQDDKNNNKHTAYGMDLLEKHFTPIGYTALFLLSESHFAIHTFPEENTTYIELSSCIKLPFDIFIKSL